jgi:hypothetical protein
MSTAVQLCARLILTDSELPAWLLQFKSWSAITVLCQATQADSEPGGERFFLRDANHLDQHHQAPAVPRTIQAVPKTKHTSIHLRLCCVHMMLTQRYGRHSQRKFSVEKAVEAA